MSEDFSTKMKRLFTKLNKTPPKPEPSTQPPPHPVSATYSHVPALQPKYVVPPLPHPCPYEHIALLATPEGLLLRPYLTSENQPESYVRILWGKEGEVSEVQNDEPSDDERWSECSVAFGIVGILTLFSGILPLSLLLISVILSVFLLASYLLVISARSDVGQLFDENHPVYSVKNVAVVPLDEPRARAALKPLMAQKHHRPSMLPLVDTKPAGYEGIDSMPEVYSPETPTPKVKFAEEDQIKMMTPATAREFETPYYDDSPPSPSTSVGSTPSELSVNTGNVAKALTEKLSFWNRLSKKSRPSAVSPYQTVALGEAELETIGMSEPPDSPGSPEPGTEPFSLQNIIQEVGKEPTRILNRILAMAPAPTTTEGKHSELEEKIVRECVREFTRGGMYFSYNFDITRSLQSKNEQVTKTVKQNALLADLNALDDSRKLPTSEDKIDILAEASPTLPLWRRVDRQYWWNEWVSKPFINAGLHSYVLPIMQGFYQIAAFALPKDPSNQDSGNFVIVDYIVISRRSRDRAGLRYQRRGIDDDANTANFVETETIMRVEQENFANVFSHVQIRGSIPLFWTQSGYSLKPAPTLSPDRTHDQNLDVLHRHFAKTLARYGPHTVVNLAEQSGKEAAITAAYRQYVEEMNEKDVQYHEYDFHKETKGMKYENISKLAYNMGRVFDSQGYFWVSNDALMSKQRGVFRVNCIDCLDRTNVVESAFSRHILNKQLSAVALFDPSEVGKTDADVVFNDVWANNGDAISRAYAGTSALKGDFTRTGKRDLTGMLNDGVNSLARMYTSTFGDWFNQAVIDFTLGNRTITVFHEFLLKLQSSDPSDLIRISKIRAEAVATSVARVLDEGEALLSGWTLFAPAELNTKVGPQFEEKVLLLSAKALYIISYDYTLEKVKMYTRVPLGDVAQITKGAYILSPLEEGSRDPLQNAGFVVSWYNYHQDTRVTSYSYRNKFDISSPPPTPGVPISPGFPTSPRTPGSSRMPTSPLLPGSPRVPTSPRMSSVATRRVSALTRVLTNAAAPATDQELMFAAFKALPIDPARSRKETGSFFEPADELTGATNCKEAVNRMVDSIHNACMNVGNGHVHLVSENDVVSLAEAQRMTSMYSKMEYGVKRLLWLGG